MASIVETVLASAMVLGLSATVAAGADSLTQADASAWLQQAGISQLVQDCAAPILASKDATELETLIRSMDPANADAAGSPEVAALQACAMKDPFGWAGTDQEWAIPLVTKYLKGN